MPATAIQIPAIQIAFALVLAISSRAFADCKEPETGTKNVPVFSPPLSEIVVARAAFNFTRLPTSTA